MRTAPAARDLPRNRDAVERVYGTGLQSLAGKRIKVTGKVVDYRGRPEIVIATPEQIVVVATGG